MSAEESAKRRRARVRGYQLERAARKEMDQYLLDCVRGALRLEPLYNKPRPTDLERFGSRTHEGIVMLGPNHKRDAR